eukprot:680649_1
MSENNWVLVFVILMILTCTIRSQRRRRRIIHRRLLMQQQRGQAQQPIVIPRQRIVSVQQGVVVIQPVDVEGESGQAVAAPAAQPQYIESPHYHQYMETPEGCPQPQIGEININIPPKQNQN